MHPSPSALNVSTVLRYICGLSFVLLALHPAQAGPIILVDFGKNTLTTGTVFGDTWNNSAAAPGVALPSIPNLVDTTGLATGITLTTDGYLTVGGADTPGVTPSPEGILYPETATRDIAFSRLGGGSNNGSLLTLSNLNDASTYTLTFYGLTTLGTDRFTEITIGATMLTYNSGIAGGGWVTFLGLSPSSGSIDIMITSPSVGSALGVLQINVVPEPSSLTLLLGGVCSLWLVRKRRQSHTLRSSH